MGQNITPFTPVHKGCLSRLAQDPSGNVIAILAFALFPMLALLGGGIDMGRGYLAQSRLQQACDAGVLAARKRLGTRAAVDGQIPTDVAETGNRFFNINFRDGAYGSSNRQFRMTVESDYSVSGYASVDVPTTLMALFNFDRLPVTVDCGSVQSFNNLDLMMVIDTTGSMRIFNPGDPLTRLETVKAVIRDFYARVDSAKAPETRIRYGFVPYNANVNVGHLLQDDWVVGRWTYQSRVATGGRERGPGTPYTYNRNFMDVSGTRSAWTEESTYPATSFGGSSSTTTTTTTTTTTSSGTFFTDFQTSGGCSTVPANTVTISDTVDEASARQETQTAPEAELTIRDGVRTHNGTRYRVVQDGSTCRVESQTDTNYVQSFEEVTVVPMLDRALWRYDALSRDVTNWRTETEGCIEERDTYAISDYANVDFSRALDLDIDLVPTPGNVSTQWRPRYSDEIYARSLLLDATGEFTTTPVITGEEFVQNGSGWYSVCPPRAQKLQEMTSAELDTYLDSLVPAGSTYHDIGMIWGGRLLSPTGLFATENAPPAGQDVARHMIWLTDGQTEPYDLVYGAYGVEGLDRRRWTPGDSTTLTQTVENRFSVACEQVRNRGIIVWVIAFGTNLNPIMEQCAGPGRAFQAANAEELGDAFEEISSALSELRIDR